ncbi:hypothetical protein SSP531S_47780 [Streptomyces spongiicola]|uniref:Uncharacterized protein n=1 Tax=Streptomyces spongiicola TaxID=1690221 RepID=A0A388T302_9ACTN|nr:hypothetical protein SSP531S_47780 [Streptomyces spongiicola]
MAHAAAVAHADRYAIAHAIEDRFVALTQTVGGTAAVGAVAVRFAPLPGAPAGRTRCSRRCRTRCPAPSRPGAGAAFPSVRRPRHSAGHVAERTALTRACARGSAVTPLRIPLVT